MRSNRNIFSNNHRPNSWIYIGADCEKLEWSKVGKTTGKLETRHRSPQNPNYFIYAAFEIYDDKVHEIEEHIHDQLANYELDNIRHFTTGNQSECYRVNPDIMMGYVEEIIDRKYSSSVRYANDTHGGISHFLCNSDDCRWYRDGREEARTVYNFERRGNSAINRGYHAGNQDVHEIDLGGGLFQDINSGITYHIDEFDDEDY
ncbi:hypothetical protein DBT73_RS13125 [Vibrio parahaemolyticus]|nr:hypothetical protein [Vibrio parahaemolyticus]EGR3040093.1 hypothetical protein [Vibrio parahaemolyticus]EJC6937108.1 hypothetical protein [Vibrio parahaemolyticus]EJC7127312.1 hypothetical protein [Vibrio parahaemolyticus]EJG0221832.1 hypothetical protein [Vibrio parahaemolyticus]